MGKDKTVIVVKVRFVLGHRDAAMPFRKLPTGEYFTFLSAYDQHEIRQKVSLHKYVDIHPSPNPRAKRIGRERPVVPVWVSC